MAKIISQTLKIQVSKMARDTSPNTDLLDPELIVQLEAVIAELAGGDVLVEITVD